MSLSNFDRSAHRGQALSRPLSPSLALSLALALVLLLAPVPGLAAQDEAWLGAEERALIDLDRRRGNGRQCLEDLDELLEEVPGDLLCRRLRAVCRFEACDYEGALADAAQAVEEALAASPALPPGEVRACVRTQATILVELGRAEEALSLLGEESSDMQPASDARDAWILGRALHAAGRRGAALEAFAQGSESRGERTWEILLDQARCQRARGQIQQASATLVAADELAQEGEGVEADILVALGDPGPHRSSLYTNPQNRPPHVQP